MMTLLLLVAVVLGLAALALPQVRVHVFSALFALTTLGTHSVLFGEAGGHTGLTSIQPVIVPSTVAVLVLALTGLAARPRGLGLGSVVPFLAYLAYGAVALWADNKLVQAGLLHLTIASLGLVAGAHLARETDTLPRLRILCSWIGMLLVLQTMVGVLQFSGVQVFYHPDLLLTDPTLAGRATGTFFHPSTLGKLAVLAAMIALPLLSTRGRRDRWIGWLVIVAGAVACAVTLGRANAAALVALVVLWTLLSRTRSVGWSTRLKIVVGLAVGALVTSPYWSARFATSATSERSYLAEVALRFLRTHSWYAGTGPNTYVEAVGTTDALTASGWPVHNLFLMTTVELGVIGAVLFALMILGRPVLTGARYRRADGLAGAYALVLLASAPGLLMIVMTGWGMLGDCLAPWAMVMGYCSWKARFSTIRIDDEGLDRLPTAAPMPMVVAGSRQLRFPPPRWDALGSGGPAPPPPIISGGSASTRDLALLAVVSLTTGCVLFAVLA